MKNIALLCLMLPGVALACELQWDYPSDAEAWIRGYHVYQGAAQVGTAAPEARSGDCTALGIQASPEPITMTAFDDANESPHSSPAAVQLIAPGVRIVIGVP